MHVDVRQVGKAIVVDLEGRLVAGTGDEILHDVMNELLGSGWTRILLNLSQVTKIDSSGIGELVSGIKLANRVGCAVKLINISDQVRTVLTLSQILPHLDIHDSEEDALEGFAEREQAQEA